RHASGADGRLDDARRARGGEGAAPAVRRRLSVAVRVGVVSRRPARRGPRAHPRAVADARRSAPRAEARWRRDRAGPQRRDDESRPVDPPQVSDPLPGSPDVHDAATDAPLAGRRISSARGVHPAGALAAVRGQSLLLHGGGEDLILWKLSTTEDTEDAE